MEEKFSFAKEPLKMFINGEWLASNDGRTFPVINPNTNEKVAEIFEAGALEIEKAATAARKAFDSGPWRRMTGKMRGELLNKVADVIERNLQKFAFLEALDTGKAIGQATYFDVPQGIDGLRYFAGKARDIKGEVVDLAVPDYWNYRLWQPVGVVLEILPWNGPLMMGLQKVANILAAGNTVIIKPPVDASLSLLEAARAFEEAGFPPGVVNLITGPGSKVGEPLASHPFVDMVSVTGSTETGSRIMQVASAGIKRLALELGGKNPNIVFKDADLEKAVEWAKMAAFNNQGEICVAGSRLLLEREIHDQFLELLKERVLALRIGFSTEPESEIGPLINRAQATKVLDYIRSGVEEGARLVIGGGSPPEDKFQKGNFVLPTIFDGVKPNMRIAREEIFGPVLSVIEFLSEEEALQIANSVDYGLAGAVFTQNLGRAHRIAKELRAGQIYINTYYSKGLVESPGVGWKKSGMGSYGITKYMVPKTVFVSEE